MFYLCVAFHGLPLFPSFLPIRDDIHARACRTNNNSKVNFLICHPETPQRILLLISFVAFICLNRLHSLNRDSVVVGKHLFAVLCVLNWTTMYYPPPSHKIVKKSGRRNEVASHSFLFSLSVSLVSSGSTYKASKLPVLRHHQTRKTCDIQWRWKNPERKEQQPLPLKKQPTTQCIPRRTPRLAYNRIPFNLAPPFTMGGLPKC